MASRLTRWSWVTLGALAGAMVALLPPGPAPWLEPDPAFGVPPTALDGRSKAVGTALEMAKLALRRLRVERGIHAALQSGRSPVVVNEVGDSVMVNEWMTSRAAALWGRIPRRPDAPRTVLVVSEWGVYAGERHQPPGTCIARLASWSQWLNTTTPAMNGAGGCLLAAEFGPPGKSMGAWIDSARIVEVPPFVRIEPGPVLEAQSHTRPIFGNGVGSDHYFPWWVSHTIEGCAEGRTELCVEALLFRAPSRESGEAWRSTLERVRISAGVPAALLRDLGPERFGRLWRGDTPVPEAYEQLTGRSFDLWARDYVQARLGRPVQDNAMSFGSWVGWVVWMGLFAGWLAARLRERPVGA